MLRRRLGLRTVLRKERVRLGLIDEYIKSHHHYTILAVIAKWLSTYVVVTSNVSYQIWIIRMPRNS
jgi:hypothetical protein